MATKNKKRHIDLKRLLLVISIGLILLGIVLFLITRVFSFFGSSSTPETSSKPEETTVSFLGVGDNLIHDTVYKDCQQADGSYDFTKLYTNIKEDVQKADIAFINQETILGGTALGLSGYPTFNSPTEIAQNLEDVGFNVANLATNHCLDRSEQGIINALDAFSKTDIVTDGIYTSTEAFDTIPTFKKKGITFSFLAYTYGTNGIEAPNGYNVSYFDEEQIKKEVQEAKKVSDVIIVSAHWGDENTFMPNDFQKQYAQLFADCGVDVVIGTHPHTIQPVEWIQGKDGHSMLCVYSLGNFMGGMLKAQNVIGGQIEFDFVKTSKDIEIQNVQWTPIIIHFEGNAKNILEERHDYKIYQWDQYNDSLAKKHVLQGYEGNSISMKEIESLTRDVIDEKYLGGLHGKKD